MSGEAGVSVASARGGEGAAPPIRRSTEVNMAVLDGEPVWVSGEQIYIEEESGSNSWATKFQHALDAKQNR